MLVRSRWASLNGPWQYAVRPALGGPEASPAREPVPKRWDGEIVVPYAIETGSSGVGRALQPDEVLHYRRTVSVPESWRGGRVVVWFEAVDHHCAVRVDGRLVAEHRGGYLPFSAELPRTDRDQVELLVSVRDPSDAGLQQRGKQSLQPRDIWYTATSGIWQPVWLEPLPEAAVTSVVAVATPDLTALDVVVEAEQPGPVTVEVGLPGGGAARAQGQVAQPVRVRLAEPRPWSPGDPHLYPVVVTTATDRVESWAALRTVRVGTPPGGSRPVVLLNDAPVLLNTPLSQGYWPESGMTAPSDEALRYDLEVVRDLGFTGVRCHIKVESRRFYHHADRLGLLVLQDAVSGGRPRVGLAGSGLVQALGLPAEDRSCWALRQAGRADRANREEFIAELEGLVRHLMGHACVVMWVPFNEAWGQFDARGAARFLRRLDPTRLVDHASGWFDQGAGDVRSRHRYVLALRRPPARDRRPYLVSEYGGLNLAVPGHLWHESARFGYRFFDDQAALAEAFTRLYRDQLVPLVRHGLAGCVYTQVSDVEIETNGLLTYDREVLKLDPDLVRALNADLEAAFQAAHR